MNARLTLCVLSTLLLLSLSACKHYQGTKDTSGKLDLLWQKSPDHNQILVVFLPGVRDNKEDFLNNGLFSALTTVAPTVDMVAADLHLAYLNEGTNISHLREDIILPAREMGYKKIWLAGISLGGLNSLLYMKSYPQDVCGLVLLSPYLGEEPISNEIISAGGIQRWQPPETRKQDQEQTLWAWLKNTQLENVYLGSGKQDRFFPLQKQLAQLLPEQNINFIAGKHRWPVWQSLWAYFTQMMQTENLLEQC